MTNSANATNATNASKYVGAGIILVQPGNDSQFLLLRGRDTGVWSFSKGHREIIDGDAPLRTAVRETYEETHLVAGTDYDIIGNSIRFGKRPYWIGVMRPTAAPVIVARNEHTTAAWFTWAEIAELTANTDVRCWIKKSRGANGEFMRLMGFIGATATTGYDCYEGAGVDVSA